MKTLDVGGWKMRCVDRGDGLPIVFVHGFPLDHTMWAEQTAALSSRSVRAIAPDLRGFGESAVEGETVTMEQFADDLAAMLDALGVARPIVLCGLSMGGYIALQFWQKYAARLQGLILCDTRAAADAPDVAAGRFQTADRVPREGASLLVETMFPRIFGETTRRRRPELLDAMRRVVAANDPRGVAAALRGMAERPDMSGRLSQIACPTLVLVGQEDISSPPAEMRVMAEAIPGARFVEIPAAGHLAPLENPAAVNAAIADFLAV